MAVVSVDNIQSIALKLPHFWADGAKLWFAQAESQFAIKNINNEQTKHHHVITALPNEIAVQLIDFLKMYRKKNKSSLKNIPPKTIFLAMQLLQEPTIYSATPGAHKLNLSYSWS